MNGVLVYFALSTESGVVTTHAFQKAQHFNARLARKSAQAKLNWTPTLTHRSLARPEKPHAQSLRLRFAMPNAQGVNNLNIEALAVRPVQEGYDRTLSFAPQGDGVYLAVADFPLPGVWDIHITARRTNEIFKLKKRIRVP